ncbi:MAG: 7-cyano-7-deazaguanine synthase QueC [Caulobacteraceae bacterium]
MAARSALTLFSGGQDSATCLAWALTRFERVETVGFDYGQRHEVELEAREEVRSALVEAFPAWRDKLGEDRLIEIPAFGRIGENALTADRPIETSADGLPSTFVPGRNLVFFTFAAALAAARRLEVLVGGMCETDYSGYPDCRRATLDAMERALELGVGRSFPIATPLMSLTKAETWAMAKALGGEALIEIVRAKTHTCYLGERALEKPWGYGCGACPACLLRASGWDDWAAAGRPVLEPAKIAP